MDFTSTVPTVTDSLLPKLIIISLCILPLTVYCYPLHLLFILILFIEAEFPYKPPGSIDDTPLSSPSLTPPLDCLYFYVQPLSMPPSSSLSMYL